MSSFHFQIITLKNSHFEFCPVFRRMTHVSLSLSLSLSLCVRDIYICVCVCACVRVCVCIYSYRAVWTYTINVNKNDAGKFLECREAASFYGANGTVLNIPGKFIITFLSSACIHALWTYFQSAECSPIPILLYSSFTRVLSPCELISMCWGQAGLNLQQ